MDKRFMMFALLVAVIFIVNQVIYSIFFPPQPKPNVAAKAEPGKAKGDAAKAGAKDGPQRDPKAPAGDNQPGEKKSADEKGAVADPATPAKIVEPAANKPQAEIKADVQNGVAQQWGTLGSADHQSPYRMLVTWNNRGATIERLELNSPRYPSADDRTGFLGHLSPTDALGKFGAKLRVVGPGTPAALAGLQAGDVISQIDDTQIASAEQLVDFLKNSEPQQSVKLTVSRGEQRLHVTAELARRPLDVMRPERENKPVEVVMPGNHDPLSLLLTIQQYDEKPLNELERQILLTTPWEAVQPKDAKGKPLNSDEIIFRKELKDRSLIVEKKYRVEKVPPEEASNPDFPAYHLWLDVSLKNTSDQKHTVAYELDGPTGLPVEGAWYASKIGWGGWGTVGLRDVVVRFKGSSAEQVTCSQIADEGFDRHWSNNVPMDYIAVDAQYFAAALIPQKANPGDVWFSNVYPIRVGEVPKDKAQIKLLDVSFRNESVAEQLEPQASITRSFQLFAGPKRPELLAHYGQPVVPGQREATLGDLVYYGWFGFVAKPMLWLLHTFYHAVGNYAIAIMMLTVLVRGAMFPLSRKQALSAQKMQELQPEIKRINEKYKNEAEKKTKAQQDLFRQHKYNPFGGCLLAFVQLPIFVGLYRSLAVDVELRMAPMFGEHVQWASNLAAPDMLWNWTGVMPNFLKFVTEGTGFFGLGPWLNILPLVTVGLFIWQQRMFMPPPADEQAAVQQKMMQFMMVFMGIMFYRVAAGLCVYFIASSIWGICERKLLPKTAIKGASGGSSGGGGGGGGRGNGGGGNGSPAGKKRQRERK